MRCETHGQHALGSRSPRTGGRKLTGIDALDWCQEAEERGVGRESGHSMDADGTCEGFDLVMICAVHERVSVPLIASGGCGGPEHFPPAVAAGADAVLAASALHFGPGQRTAEAGRRLRAAGYEVR